MPAKTTRPYGLVTVIQLEITYPNNDTKRQYWNNNWIEKTSKLIFWNERLDGPDAKRMKTESNWRHNACMVRYLRGQGDPVAICQRGGDRRFLSERKYRRGRGRPTRLLLKIARSIKDPAVQFEHDEKWLAETAELLFFPQEGLTAGQPALLFPSPTNWRKNAALVRKKHNGDLEGIFPGGWAAAAPNHRALTHPGVQRFAASPSHA